ncbi:peptidyl-tRNA hydrolase [Phlyctema vagabunda]|uniref:peptidyl-tRNA hydrolase n=1 Tax=Phlyctema vagabunda TaxID=108571 RepID=A0ABR4PKW8_9HELO
MAQPTRLLVCSIGNPAPYLSTFHSAGHVVLNSLRTLLAHPPFMKSRAHGNGQLSPGLEYTLWQSPSLMNISGVGVAAAWRQFTRDTPSDMATQLVIIHDELELPLGQMKAKKGELSAKGHNGLKSCKEQLRDVEWWRIGIGIGRPISREPAQVADYVLKKMGPMERAKIEGSAVKVATELRRLAGAS